MQTEVRAHVLYVTGDVTMDTLTPALLKAFRQQLVAGADTVDLSGVGAADSACVALLVAALRDKQKQRQRLHFVGLPAGLTQLAALYEVDQWMGT